MGDEGALSEAGDARKDLICTLGPHKRLWLLITDIDERLDGALEFADTAMHPTWQLFGRQFREPALDEVEPGAVGRREMHVESGPLRQPGADERGLVGTVVVQNDVDLPVRRHVGIEAVQELAKLTRAMATMRFRHDRAGLRVERGKQRRGAMPLVVVCPTF